MKIEIHRLFFSACAVLLAVFSTGCGTLSIARYSAGPSKDARTAESQGLSIVVDPVLDNGRANTYFKVDPDSKGVGIIYLQVANNSTNATWLVNEENMHLLIPGHAGDMNAQDQEVEGDYGEADALEVTAMPFLLVPIIDIVAVPFMLSANKAASTASVIQKNFVDKEWLNQTLSPGQRAQGFIYFNVERHFHWADSATLRLDCLDVQHQQTNTITVPLHL